MVSRSLSNPSRTDTSTVHGQLFSLAWGGVGWGGVGWGGVGGVGGWGGGGVGGPKSYDSGKVYGILSFLLFRDPRLHNIQGSTASLFWFTFVSLKQSYCIYIYLFMASWMGFS
jgi:hypothetical protein